MSLDDPLHSSGRGREVIDTRRGAAGGINFTVCAAGRLAESVGRDGFMEPGERVRFTPPILLGFSNPEFGPGTSPSADDGI